MPRPFATALVDTYNHELFIEEALVSVLRQDFPASEMEILVVDDGSTDRTSEIVRKFAPRVRLIRKQNGGQASAFNAGLNEARGEIVCFLDGDDWWAPEKVSRVSEVFATEPAVGIVGHSISEVLADGSTRLTAIREQCRFRANTPDGAHLFRMRKNFLGSSRMAVRAELLQRIRPIPEAIVIEADEYIFTIAAALSQAVVLPQALTYYRHHAASLFMVADNDTVKLRGKLRALQSLCNALRQKLSTLPLDKKTYDTIMEAIEVETTHLRLIVDGGYPWETIATELTLLRVFRRDASLGQHLFTCARLLPAAVLPPRTYYKWTQRLSRGTTYQKLRKKFFPFPVPGHVRNSEGGK
jgi:glycosyltransferase involved in cell wall biosynthesis